MFAECIICILDTSENETSNLYSAFVAHVCITGHGDMGKKGVLLVLFFCKHVYE